MEKVNVRARRTPGGFLNLGKVEGRQVVFTEIGEEREVAFERPVERAVDAGFLEIVEKPKAKPKSKSKDSSSDDS